MRCFTLLLVLLSAALLTGCGAKDSTTSSWKPVSPSFVETEVVQVVRGHVKSEPFASEHEWVWEDAIFFENDSDHYLVWVYYVSPVRGKIWTWFEVDEQNTVVAGGGFQEG